LKNKDIIIKSPAAAEKVIQEPIYVNERKIKGESAKKKKKSTLEKSYLPWRDRVREACRLRKTLDIVVLLLLLLLLLL
jgi:hypothetical protein